jgi:hypothetical protein
VNLKIGINGALEKYMNTQFIREQNGHQKIEMSRKLGTMKKVAVDITIETKPKMKQ